MTDLLKELTSSIPLQFHLSFLAQVDDAVADLHKRATNGRYTRQQMGMSIYPELERSFLTAGLEAGLFTAREHTEPRGGSYAIIRAGRFVIGRHSGNRARQIPSARSRYRRRLAALNHGLDPQTDLLNQHTRTNSSPVFLSCLTVPDYKSGSGCIHFGIGAYTPDFKRWGAYWTQTELMNAYAGTESIDDTALPDVRDQAVPKLKKR